LDIQRDEILIKGLNFDWNDHLKLDWQNTENALDKRKHYKQKPKLRKDAAYFIWLHTISYSEIYQTPPPFLLSIQA